MKNTIITIDLAKMVFELAVTNAHYRITQRKRLDLAGFKEFIHQQKPATVVMEAFRCDGLKPVALKSLEQQELQHMHSLREQWKQTRQKRMNFLRGVFRE